MSGFLIIFTLVMATVHFYIWKRVVHDTRLAKRTRRWATPTTAALCAMLPITLIASRQTPREFSWWIAAAGYTWLGVMFYVLVLLLALDAVRLLDWVHTKLTPPRAPEVNLSRRLWLARTGAVTALSGASSLGLIGLWSGLGEIETPEVPVRLQRLPPSLSGYRIAQLTDVHIGDLLGTRFLRGVVEQTNRQRPDLIVITGDLVDGSVAELGAAVSELAKLKARDGVCFVTGNHEYYSGAEPWMEFLRGLGIVVLNNERLSIGDAGGTFDLIGVPDHHARPLRPDMALAAGGRDPERELVVLAHQPVQVRDAVALDAGLQISGHTHGGQLVPFNLLTGLVQPHVAGLELAGGRTQIYTSRGTGFWGPPMRVLAPAEIPTIVLTT